MIDNDEILRALQCWFTPGDVFEVRVLDAVTSDYRREHVESGYFDFEHIASVPEALKRLLSYRGVYVTVNPVKPDLLARAVNRIRPACPAVTENTMRRWRKPMKSAMVCPPLAGLIRSSPTAAMAHSSCTGLTFRLTMADSFSVWWRKWRRPPPMPSKST